MRFSTSGQSGNKFKKRERSIFIPRYVRALNTPVVINDIHATKVIFIPIDKAIDLFSFCPLNELTRSKQLQHALNLKLIESQPHEYL